MSRYGVVIHSELAHHGIKGQKWGVRRYENPDGSLTEAGKKRYSHKRAKNLHTTRMLTGLAAPAVGALAIIGATALNPAAIPTAAVSGTLFAVAALSKKEINKIAKKANDKEFKKIARDYYLEDYKEVKNRASKNPRIKNPVPEEDYDAFHKSKAYEELRKEANRRAVKDYKDYSFNEEWEEFQKYAKENNVPFDEFYEHNSDIDTFMDGYLSDANLEEKYYNKWKKEQK